MLCTISCCVRCGLLLPLTTAALVIIVPFAKHHSVRFWWTFECVIPRICVFGGVVSVVKNIKTYDIHSLLNNDMSVFGRVRWHCCPTMLVILRLFFFSYACHEPLLVSHETASSSAECSRDKPSFSFVRGQDSTMWDIVWVSPQGHRSVSVSRHFLLQAPQCPCSVRKRNRTHYYCATDSHLQCWSLFN